MQQLAWNLKYRPQNFKFGFVGQEVTAQMLEFALDNNKLGQVALLTGERGCGKTSSARIIARGLNCVNGPTSQPCGVCEFCRDDAMLIIEIDAASNRGVEEVRNLKESLKYMSHPNKYKIYIIDEVHMMTTEAFNALLKTLEEPPSNAVFILCTTDPEKLPATIISRTKHFKFGKIPVQLIQQHMKDILIKEGFSNFTDESLMVIAEHSNGGMRDALTLLEQCLLLNNNLTADNVYKVIGTIDHTSYLEILKLISQNNVHDAIKSVKKIIYQGIQPKYFYQNFITVITNVISNKAYTDRDKKLLTEINIKTSTLLKICDILQKDSKESFVELSIIKILQIDEIKSISEPSPSNAEPAFQEVTASNSNSNTTIMKENNSFIHSLLALKVFQKAQSSL